MPLTRAKNIVLWFLKPFNGREQYWRVVLLCFMAASTFWLLNALNKNYTNIRITYPVRFEYDQREYIPLRPLPEEIVLNVSGKGWKLLRKYLMLDVQPADIPMEGIIRQKSISANLFRSNVANALDGLQLNFIVTDSLRFKFDKQVKRKIPLAIDTLHLPINQNYTLVKPITITPSEVEFEGPVSVLDSLPNPFILSVPKTPIKGPFKSYVPLDYPYKALVKSDIVEAEIAFDVKPLAWQNLIMIPTLQNKPSDSVRLQPATVTIKYSFLPEQGVQIDPTQFSLVANCAQLNPKDSMVTVELTGKPANVHRIVLQPNKIKVIPVVKLTRATK
ncbi:YbbR-like domain-containing protein [Adhaeribacter radiodurans]|uniref:YbbR-like domain-containing protein n=1 Tax=Adhaeribacter radiodurans TaxID=2745197 RepID=A0A7L7L9V7_9BACT|nr:hypothetical protein [Adhaeribacter radiodurans]QMU29517.1 hypothetical protein HUW48_16395 [Adhaeribacter radiodurans]